MTSQRRAVAIAGPDPRNAVDTPAHPVLRALLALALVTLTAGSAGAQPRTPLAEFAAGCKAGRHNACFLYGRDSRHGTLATDPDRLRHYVRACQLGSEAGCVWAGTVVDQPESASGDRRAVGFYERGCEVDGGESCGRAASCRLNHRCDYNPALASELLHAGCREGSPSACRLLAERQHWYGDMSDEPGVDASAWATACNNGDLDSCGLAFYFQRMGPLERQDRLSRTCFASSPPACRATATWWARWGAPLLVVPFLLFGHVLLRHLHTPRARSPAEIDRVDRRYRTLRRALLWTLALVVLGQLGALWADQASVEFARELRRAEIGGHLYAEALAVDRLRVLAQGLHMAPLTIAPFVVVAWGYAAADRLRARGQREMLPGTAVAAALMVPSLNIVIAAIVVAAVATRRRLAAVVAGAAAATSLLARGAINDLLVLFPQAHLGSAWLADDRRAWHELTLLVEAIPFQPGSGFTDPSPLYFTLRLADLAVLAIAFSWLIAIAATCLGAPAPVDGQVSSAPVSASISSSSSGSSSPTETVSS